MHFESEEISSMNDMKTLLRIPRTEGEVGNLIRVSATPTELDYLHINLLYCGGKYNRVFKGVMMKLS